MEGLAVANSCRWPCCELMLANTFYWEQPKGPYCIKTYCYWVRVPSFTSAVCVWGGVSHPDVNAAKFCELNESPPVMFHLSHRSHFFAKCSSFFFWQDPCQTKKLVAYHTSCFVSSDWLVRACQCRRCDRFLHFLQEMTTSFPVTAPSWR